MVAEPVGAVCGGPPIHRDHQVAIQEDLGVVEWGGRHRTCCHELHPHPRARQLWWGLEAEDPIGARSRLARAAAASSRVVCNPCL